MRCFFKAFCYSALALASLAGPGLNFFESPDAVVKSPLTPLPIPSGEIPLDNDPDPAMFDRLRAGQDAERLLLSVKELIRLHRSAAEIRAALEKIGRWTRKVDIIRAQQASDMAGILETKAARETANVRVQARLAWYWVNELERERDNILAKIRPDQRILNAAQVRVNAAGDWKFPPGLLGGRPIEHAHSRAYPMAKAAVSAALRAGSNDPEALMAAAWFHRRVFDTAESGSVHGEYVKRAAEMRGPWADVARVYAFENVFKAINMRAQAHWLRSVQTHTTWRDTQQSDGSIKRTTTTIILHQPTAADIAQANQLDGEAAQVDDSIRRQIDATLQHGPYNVEMWLTLSGYKSGLERDRILRYALFLDPGDYRLHAARAEMWDSGGRQDLMKASDYAERVLRNRKQGDYTGFFRELNTKYADPFTAYAIALEGVRDAPLDPDQHENLATSYLRLRTPNVAGSEVGDAIEQGELEFAMTYYTSAYKLDHPEEWIAGQKREGFTNELALAQFEWGEFLKMQGKFAEARVHYQECLKLNPGSEQAHRRLQTLPQ